MAAPGIALNAEGRPTTFTAINWQNADNVMRTVHEQKVNDCEKNLDGLLVFAGLYSAVLTAFLVESYKMLQPDPNSNTTFLLQQIAYRITSFSINNNFMNTTALLGSTAAGNTSPVFRPTLNAKRVNGLWFASLVLSLASASFCITVKQWLREFLAMGDADARYRLRIRYFRDAGLSRWIVYDIAAILPLFIQASLTLFFVGLCFFTAEVNKTIGHATLGLICAWAFLFIFTTMLPLAWHDCPYRVPFLKVIIVAMNPVKFANYLLSSNRGSIDLSPISRAERGAQNTGDNDWEIMLKVASLELNDGLLTSLNTMWKALEPSAKGSIELIQLIRESINHRLTNNSSKPTESSSVLSPDLLSPAAYKAFIEMVASVVQVKLNRHGSVLQGGNHLQNPQTNDQESFKIPKDKLKDWLHECFYVLFTCFDYSGSEQVDHVICQCLTKLDWRNILLDFLKVEREDPQGPPFALLLKRIKGGVAMIENFEDLNSILDSICPVIGEREGNDNGAYFLAPSLLEFQSFEFDVSVSQIKMRNKKNLAWAPQLLKRVVDLSASRLVRTSGRMHDVEEPMRYLLLESTDPRGTAEIIRIAWGDASVAKTSRTQIEQYIKPIFLSSAGCQELTPLLVHIVQVMDPKYQPETKYKVHAYPNVVVDSPSKSQLELAVLFPLQMCYFYLNLLDSDVALVGDKENNSLWKNLFRVLAQDLQKFKHGASPISPGASTTDASTTSSDAIDAGSTAQKCSKSLASITKAAQLQLDDIFSQELVNQLVRIQGDKQIEAPSPPPPSSQPTSNTHTQVFAAALY